MKEKLKPCPFCGGNEWTVGAPFFKISDDRMHIVHCMVCGVQIIPQAENWDRAVEKVNMRAPVEEKSISDIVEEIKMDICDHYCKWPNEWDEEELSKILEDGKCADCPLSKL